MSFEGLYSSLCRRSKGFMFVFSVDPKIVIISLGITIGIYKVNYCVNNTVISVKLTQSSKMYIAPCQRSMLEFFC